MVEHFALSHRQSHLFVLGDREQWTADESVVHALEQTPVDDPLRLRGVQQPFEVPRAIPRIRRQVHAVETVGQ